MKKFEKYGTLLTRSEAKEIRGGGGDTNPQHPIDDQGDPGGGGGGCSACTAAMCDAEEPCRNSGGRGKCLWHSFGCSCLQP